MSDVKIPQSNGQPKTTPTAIIEAEIVDDYSHHTAEKLHELSESLPAEKAAALYLELAQRYLDFGKTGQVTQLIRAAEATIPSSHTASISQLAQARAAILKQDYSTAKEAAKSLANTELAPVNGIRYRLLRATVLASEGESDSAMKEVSLACLSEFKSIEAACWTTANSIALLFNDQEVEIKSLNDYTSMIVAQLMQANNAPFSLNFSNGLLFNHSSNDALERSMAYHTQAAPPVIGALLPISSRFGTAAQSTYKGIEAALKLIDAGKRPRLVLIDTGDNPASIDQHIKEARKRGVTALIGPLGTEYATNLKRLDDKIRAQIMLSGNCPAAPPSAHCIRYALSPESEADIMYEHLQLAQYKNPTILYGQNSWGERFRLALSQKLPRGFQIQFIAFAADTEDFTPIIKPLFAETAGTLPTDAIVVAGTPDHARLIRPQVTYFSGSHTPVIGTTTIYDGTQNSIQDSDLEGTLVPILPIDDIDDPTNTDIQLNAGQYWPHPNSDSVRFFALGFDTVLLLGKTLNQFPISNLPGRTGILSGDGKNVSRTVQWGRFTNGLVEKVEIADNEPLPIIQ